MRMQLRQDLVSKVKVPPKDNEIFTPEQFEQLLRAARPPDPAVDHRRFFWTPRR